MIPDFEEESGQLPPGEHKATWQEIVERYGGNLRRDGLLKGLREALLALKKAGCKTFYLDGSFVTAKPEPGDFDACWELDGVDLKKLDPVLKTFANHRAAQKAKFGGEMFPADSEADDKGRPFRQFFQYDRNDDPKGIIVIDLERFQ